MDEREYLEHQISNIRKQIKENTRRREEGKFHRSHKWMVSAISKQRKYIKKLKALAD